MRKICIFGTGGFAKEVFWLAHRCDREVISFIDIKEGGFLYQKPIMSEGYFDPSKHLAVVAVGNPQLRKKIVNKIIENHGDECFATLIHPSANIMGDDVFIGKGSVICANCILTCNIQLGEYSQLNLGTSIGHDVTTGKFFTTAPGTVISGKVITKDCVYFGTNSSVIENVNVAGDTTIGASACVTKDLDDSGTYVGIPARLIKEKNEDRD